MISYTGLLIGSTALTVLICCIIFGTFFVYKSKKLKARLLFYAGFLIFFTGFFYLGASADFLAILLTQNNLNNEGGLHGILSFMWVAPAVILAIYLGAEQMQLKKKWYILSIYIILAVIFELFLFLDTNNSFRFQLNNPGEDLIDSSFVLGSPTFILIVIFLISNLIFNGFGLLIKGIKSTGIIRKKFLLFSTAFIIFTVCGALDSFINPGIGLIFVRIGMISYAWFSYMALKPA